MLAQRLPLAAFLLLILAACSQDNGTTLSAPDAYARVQANTLTLIDIRHADEWRKTGVATGSLRIDMADSQGEDGFIIQVTTAMNGNKNMSIGLLSTAGNRSANAQQVLRKMGFSHVYNIKEGMQGSNAGPGWIARGLPMQPCPDC